MVTAAPDRLEHLLETLATAHHAALGFQDRMGDAVDVAADLFQDIGGAIDHGVEQVHQHRLAGNVRRTQTRSEEHTSELQSHLNLVCRLLLEKKKIKKRTY